MSTGGVPCCRCPMVQVVANAEGSAPACSGQPACLLVRQPLELGSWSGSWLHAGRTATECCQSVADFAATYMISQSVMTGLQAAAQTQCLTGRLAAQVDAQTLDETVKDTLQCYMAAPEQYPEDWDADMYKDLPLHTVQGVGLFPAYAPQLPVQDMVMPQQASLSVRAPWYSICILGAHPATPRC